MDIEFEWDEEKRRTNIEKHGLDFLRARTLFDGRPLLHWQSPYEHEDRFLTVGKLDDGESYLVVWTHRTERIRIISFRRANDAAVRKCNQAHRERD